MPLTQRDTRISTRLKRIMDRVEKIVKAETDVDCAIALVVQPFGTDDPYEVAELQYISNAPREFVHGAFKTIVEKWDVDASVGWKPPHERQ